MEILELRARGGEAVIECIEAERRRARLRLDLGVMCA
jgi:hypothetical protein